MLPLYIATDGLCGLVVPGWKSSGPGFDSPRYQIFLVVDLKRDTLSLLRINKELLV
jgi:hypothetical protein